MRFLPLLCLARLILSQSCPCSTSTHAQPPAGTVSAKRGIAYDDVQSARTFQRACDACTWAYNWGWADDGLSDGIEFVPMLWGEKTVADFQSQHDYIRSGAVKSILSFNEPDHPDQANMAVGDAVDAHIRYLNQYADDAKIGSPGVTSDETQGTGGNPKSLEWLRQFLDLCQMKGCRVDFCAVHWYGVASQADELIQFLGRARETCLGMPVWLTEFQAAGSEAEVASFLTKVLPFLDEADFIQRYSWFKASTENLLQTANTLSEYGKVYACNGMATCHAQ